ncbi:MAG TPA: hypothetical protein VHL08_06845 [Dongiaceae bacterium]|jgi:hypothetical protein|nr:hypothetical protein [Dongiaceae bacterium]
MLQKRHYKVHVSLNHSCRCKFIAANDNGGTTGALDPHLLTIARTLGRQIARERSRISVAANDSACRGDKK